MSDESIITQTDDEIKIVIELNRLVTRKPDIVLLPTYLKFNSPPIFFERHLTQEIDEMASYCRIIKNEARIILVKKNRGIWPELFEKLTKEELFKRRLEISDQVVARNTERDKRAIERFENKRRAEIDKEIRRESAIRDRVKKFQETACRDALMVGTRVDTPIKTPERLEYSDRVPSTTQSQQRVGTPMVRNKPMTSVRSVGKINFGFSDYALRAPKRQSQEGLQMPPFKIEDNMDKPE